MDCFGRTQNAAEESRYRNAEEKVKLAVMGSYGTDGNLDNDLLKENINNIDGLADEVDNASKRPLGIIVDGYPFIIGELGEVTRGEKSRTSITIENSITNINTSAKVSLINKDKVTIDQSSIKLSELTGDFKIDDKIMLYISNTNNINDLGRYEIFNITNVDENIITLDNDIDTEKFTNDNSQIIKILNYDDVIIKDDVIITPSIYDGNSGGIVAIQAQKIILNGKIDASKCGYDSSNLSPLNGNVQSSGNNSSSGASNKYQGGNGGRNYQGYTGVAPVAVGITNDILMNKQMTFGGGCPSNIKGGGIIYIESKELQIGSEYAISSNGEGGKNRFGGAAGGTICINSKKIEINCEQKNYFVGANAGGGSSEYYLSEGNWPTVNGEDGTNIQGGNGANTPVRTGGKGYLSNGGGGAQHGFNGGNASENKGGNGANASSSTGYNAGSGGGGGGYVSIYTNSDLSSITLVDAAFYPYKF